ncbi:phage tail sheath subtilisin-like domain-containing protein [Rhodopseudomonas sp. HC1]|uniref:phage tail sheath C-terminal domain-containing protein n=1 Tax=Rhodopseudomonas infernalis TaxID=2897386 RepID=UPI001EE8E1AA|nr:phage tail sheath C-terminal domain-containing protein [Rhodopseudomonas infernalis]MCG6204197.1 phage tail sheath subtilisin-like domain-containing protein [Rhodopseudomonas infernalis]
MSVLFNNIPPTLRVPLFYAEVNAGANAYQGPSRTLVVGQKTSGGSAAVDTAIRLDGDPQALFGAGSMLSEMSVWARQNHPFGEIWCLPVADPAGVAQTHTITVAPGILGSAGSLVLYIGGEKVEVAVNPTDTNANVATALAAAINQGYFKFGRPLSFSVIATVASNVVTLTARNVGAIAGKQTIITRLVGDESALRNYLTIAATTTGTGTPALGSALAALGDIEFDFICAPYADTTSLDVIKDFLGGTSGRWSPMQQLYGHYFTVMFDTFSNQAAFGVLRNDPNVTLVGVTPDTTSPPWRWAAAWGARIASDKNIGGEVDQAYRISRPVQTLDLVGIRPPLNRANWPTTLQRNQLYQDGIASFTVMVDGTVLIDRSVTTYQVNAYNQPDITWLDVETRLQMVYFVRYMRQRITQKYGRCALADDNPTGNPGIVTVKILKAECVHIYTELEQGGLVDNSEQFAKSLIVERSSDPNRVNAYLPVDVVNQFRVFAANATTFLQYAA